MNFMMSLSAAMWSMLNHALAIDERRKLFLPTLWNKSETVLRDSNHKQKMEQRWFPGVHSNIGGGYIDSGLSDLALLWIINNAKETGLEFKEEELQLIKPNPLGELRNSLSLMYRLWFPLWREIIIDDDYSNQFIDESTWLRFQADKNYRPENLKKHALAEMNKEIAGA